MSDEKYELDVAALVKQVVADINSARDDGLTLRYTLPDFEEKIVDVLITPEMKYSCSFYGVTYDAIKKYLEILLKFNIGRLIAAKASITINTIDTLRHFINIHEQINPYEIGGYQELMTVLDILDEHLSVKYLKSQSTQTIYPMKMIRFHEPPTTRSQDGTTKEVDTTTEEDKEDVNPTPNTR